MISLVCCNRFITAALISTLISALVSLVIVAVVEPLRRKGEEKELRKQQLLTWMSDMKSNLGSLQDPKHRDLVRNMTHARRRILVVNEFIDVYNATLGVQLPYLVMSGGGETLCTTRG
jgi:hypothetical protein